MTAARARTPRLPSKPRIRDVRHGRFELGPGQRLVVRVPVVLQSEGNAREHHYIKAKRVREQREATRRCLEAYSLRPPAPPLHVTIVRLLGPRARGLDDDNLAGAGKHVRDEIADWLGIDDRHSDLVSYEVTEACAPEHGTRIEIRRKGKR